MKKQSLILAVVLVNCGPVFAACPSADLSGDCRVDLEDISMMSGQWLTVYDVNDLTEMANQWLSLGYNEVSDHVFAISIGMCWDYQNPDYSNDTIYGFDEFWMSTDGRVERIEFLAPSGITYKIPQIAFQEIVIPGGIIETEWWYDNDSGTYEWKYQTVFDEPNGLAEFGDGKYKITVYYDDGNHDRTTVWFGIPNTNDFLPQPTQEPKFTSFAHGAVFTSPDPNFLEWEPCEDPAKDDLWIEVDLDKQDTYEEHEFLFDSGETGFDLPLVLSEGLWEVDLAFGLWYETQNSDGINVSVSKGSESDYEFTVSTP